MRRFLFVLLALGFALPTSAKPQHRTVLDYFKMLPSKWFNDSEEPRMKQLREGFDRRIPVSERSVVDLKNDFLHFNADAAGQLEVAVFRFHGHDTVAVLNDYEGTTLSFYHERNGHLVDVTTQIFPFRFRGTVTHVLPRRKTTIQVLKGGWPDKPKAVLARFFWRGGHFVRG